MSNSDPHSEDKSNLIELTIKIVESFKFNKNIYCDFVEKIFFGSGQEMYDKAIFHKVHSLERQKLIDSGFISFHYKVHPS